MDTLQPSFSGPRSRAPHRKAAIRLLLIVAVAGTFLAGMLAGEITGSPATGASSSLVDAPGFATLQSVWDLIHDEFVDPESIDDQTLLYGAARGMVDSLGDPGHSTFLDPDEAKAFRAALSGELIGLGISIEFQDGEPVVVAPIKDSPAEKAGILPSDVIVEIDGIPTLGMTDAEVSLHLRGEAGTPVTLTIERAGETDLLEITVVRERIDLDPVSWAFLPGDIALVQLHEFSSGSGQELAAALRDATAGGATKGIVLDLRNNPGGLVNEAITVASQFMPEGTTIYLQQERGGQPEPVNTIGNDGAALETPVVVLVNRASASAAEIVAASLQDNGRAELVGERTYGTGTVVSTFDLDGGSALALGTAFWKTPDGELVWKIGLEPDVAVRLPSSVDIIDLSEDGERLTTSQLDASADVQLQAAVNVLVPSSLPAA